MELYTHKAVCLVLRPNARTFLGVGKSERLRTRLKALKMATSAPGRLIDDTASPHRISPPEACISDEGIEFIELLPKEYECPLCLSVLKDPTQTNCGHHFCLPCIGRITLAKGPCPICKTEEIQVFPDASVKRKINALQVRCNLKSHGCPWVGELAQLEPHLDVQKGDCDFVEVDCDFSDIGCTTKIWRKDVPRHREENVHKHLFLMVVRGPKSESEFERRVQEQRAELIQKELQKKDEQIKLLQQQTTLLQQQASQSQKDKDEQIRSLQQAIVVNEDKIKTLEERVHKLEACPPFAFTMMEFSEHKASNKEWRSPPFYSHPGGYKLCLVVFANGVGSREGTCLSSSFCFMQGEYDDILTWPKGMNINIELFNHNTGKWERSGSMSCNTGKRKKPTTPCERVHDPPNGHNIKHAYLAPFINNDCMQFKISNVVLNN